MRILDNNILYDQDITIDNLNKSLYGEVFTPYSLIKDMFCMFPIEVFKNKNLKWLDTGAGCGFFSIFLFHTLLISLYDEIPNYDERVKHIISNMIFMVEINYDNCDKLRDIFGERANIYNIDFLDIKYGTKYDIIIGNPPYNINGYKKVPTNNILSKTQDGNMVWTYFIKASINMLAEDGYLCYIVPNIWMKPDKLNMYDYMLNFKIEKIKCLTNTETNRYFKGNAQTPTCYFLLKNTNPDNIINIYDKSLQVYVPYSIENRLPIPVFGISIINKLLEYTKQYGNLKVIKTNMPKKHVTLSQIHSTDYPYQNIKTCVLTRDTPTIIKEYSNFECPYCNIPKIVLAHKMYGFPYIDMGGIYGISNRDNYVIINRTLEDMVKIKEFLSTKLALYLFECTRYRMKYLEKYIFELIPDITKIPNFPNNINDSTIAAFFNFSLDEIIGIKNLHKKDYKYPII